MSENKTPVSLTILAGLAIGVVAGITIANWWPLEIGAECPAKLKAYCTDWSVESSDIEDSQEHLDVPDEFSIRATAKGVEPPIWLTAKTALKNRWKGQKKLKLREIENNGAVECMVGRLNLAHGEGDHDWHQFTFRTEKKSEENPDIVLAMCVTKRENGDWPNACHIDDCNEGRQSHGGRAHAQD